MTKRLTFLLLSALLQQFYSVGVSANDEPVSVNTHIKRSASLDPLDSPGISEPSNSVAESGAIVSEDNDNKSEISNVDESHASSVDSKSDSKNDSNFVLTFPQNENDANTSGLRNLLGMNSRFKSALVTNSLNDVNPKGSFMLILNDIKDYLRSMNHTHFTSNNSHPFNNNTLLANLLNKINNIQTTVNECKEDSQQKINLVMENFSTLKLLLSSHEDRIQDNSQQILTTKRTVIEHFQESTQPQKNVTLDDINQVKNISQEIDHQVRKSQETMNATLREIISEVLDLKTNFQVNSEELQNLNLSMAKLSSNSTCQCQPPLQKASETGPFFTTLMKSSIEILRRDITELKSKNEDLKVQIDSLQRNAGTLEGPSKIENSNASSGSVEAKLAKMELELESLKDLKLEVNHLRDMLELRNASQGLCVWPYTRSEDGCYYVNIEDRKNWSAARERCKELQGDLASPRNFEAFRQFLVSRRLSRSYSFWVSGNDQETEGQWRWTDGRPVSKSVWASGQPNRLKSSNCLEIRPGFRFVGADEDCREQKFFICQQKTN